MRWLELRCRECGEDSEVPCDGDNPLLCPECLAVDEMYEVEEED